MKIENRQAYFRLNQILSQRKEEIEGQFCSYFYQYFKDFIFENHRVRPEDKLKAYCDHCLPGDSDVIEVPISTTRFLSVSLPPYHVRSSSFRLQRRRVNGRQTGLGHAIRAPEESWQLMRKLLSEKPAYPPRIVVVPFHPWEFFQGNISDTPPQYLSNIEEWLIKLTELKDVEFSTLDKACGVRRDNNRKQSVNQKVLITLSPLNISWQVQHQDSRSRKEK